MKGKKYYTNSREIIAIWIGHIIGVALISFLIVLCFWTLQDANAKISSGAMIVFIVILFFLLLFLIYEGFVTTCFRITLNAKKIWINREINFPLVTTQFHEEVNFDEIVDIRFVKSRTNSLNQSYVGLPNGKVYRKFLVFVKKDGKETRMYVDYFSINTIIKIIDDVIARMKALGVDYQGKDAARVMGECLKFEKNKKGW